MNEALLARLRAGDCTAEDLLIRANEPLARRVAGKWVRLAKGRLEYDDLLSETLVGLLAAVRAFRPDQGAVFCTYAYAAMWHHCQRAVMNADPIRVPVNAQLVGVQPAQVLSLDYPLGDEETLTLGEALPAPDDTAAAAIGAVWVDSALSRLEPRQRLAVALHVVEEETCATMAERLGLTREGGRRLVKRGLERLAASVAAA